MSIGKTMLGRRHVLPSVVSSLHELQIEGTFTSGSYLVTVHNPICSEDGDLEKALYGSFLPIPSKDLFPPADPAAYEPKNQPGAVIVVKDKKITLNEGRKRIRLKVVSKGDRPIQVCVEKKRHGDRRLTNIIRLGRITTSSRQTPSYPSTVSEHVDIA